MRNIFAVLLIVSLVGLGTCDLLNKEYKTFVLGMLFATANIIIFLVK